jgi:hypothetical protein
MYSEVDKRILPPVLLAIIVVVTILALLLRKKSERVRAIPMAIVALMLLFIEAVKQRWNLLGEFDYYFLPLHYCSLFFVIIPLAELFGTRMSRIFRPVAVCMSFMVSVATCVYPCGIMGDVAMIGVNFRETHGFLFHHLIILYFLLAVAMRLCHARPRDAFLMGGIGVVYSAVALPLAYRWGANYCNFLESVIPAIEELRLEWGQLKYTVFTILTITVGGTFSAFVYITLYTAVSKFLGIFFSVKKSE